VAYPLPDYFCHCYLNFLFGEVQTMMFVVLAAPKVSCVTTSTCRVDWMPLKPMADDAIVYIVQMSVGQTGSYKQVSG